MINGKMVLSQDVGFKRDKNITDGRQKVHKKWTLPPSGRVKLNVDGSWSSHGTAWAGLVVHDHTGAVIIAPYKCLEN